MSGRLSIFIFSLSSGPNTHRYFIGAKKAEYLDSGIRHAGVTHSLLRSAKARSIVSQNPILHLMHSTQFDAKEQP